MPVPVIASKPGEYTRVGLDTEVKIPWLTYVFNSLVLMIVDTGLWSIGWVIWYRARARMVSFWRWLTMEWVEWFSIEWPWYAVTLILCWIGPSALAYLYRLFIEQLAKSTPTYDAMDPAIGIWNPLGHRMIEGEEEELETETVSIDLTTQPDGRRRKQIKRVPDFPVDRKSRLFYRAVANGAATFSEKGAGRFGISQNVFKHHIRDALIYHKLATWKDDIHHNQGVNLSGDAMRTLERLGR